MSGSIWYSCFDLLSGYYQILKDVSITAFQTPHGMFDYLAVPMGFSNAPATFNRSKQYLKICVTSLQLIDDVYVFTKHADVESHLAAVRKVFELCKAKVVLETREVPIVLRRDFVGRNGVRIDPDKVSVIRNWLRPQTAKELQSFLCTTVYVQRFCKGYSELSAPLFNLIVPKDKRSLTWSPESCKTFEQLKEALTSASATRF
ncbi:LOW QUALITY PROTEIN: Retrovirus-related Pol Polyprotein from transposon 412 [Phytophthora megakarya]|uniref:Retrovirus-related Pol Polyprotein from transposon 412 n=1 Tax=Phytophthora megakarya TaxID=4795 RepID=A0A225WFV0_9STRA|nr:LOW QUALITY PROTEIN: Retrovirus-related Pol Polyprotein from transposon 412 [Phytophthora megakarya]